MKRYSGFVADELPEKEMKMLYNLLGKNLPKTTATNTLTSKILKSIKV